MEVLSVSVVVFTIMAGFSILFPILPFWASNLGASPFEIGLMFSAYPLAQFLSSRFWGRLSDKFGYKVGIAIGSLGFSITSLLIPLYPSPIYIIAIRFLGGLISSAALPSSSAYIGAISSERTYAKNFGIYGASLGLGIVVGPFIGGIASKFSLSLPFLFSGILGFLAFLFTLAFVRNVKGRFQEGTLRAKLPKDKTILVILSFLGMLVMANFEAILALFVKDRFALGSAEVGYLLGISGLIGAVFQASASMVINLLGYWRVIAISLFGSALISLIVPFSPNFSFLSLLVILVSLSGLSQPAILSLLSMGVENRGEVMGAYQSATSFGRIIGPVMAGFLYSVNFKLPFLFASFVSLLSLLIWFKFKNLYTPV
jgi:Arabinose efflux permease